MALTVQKIKSLLRQYDLRAQGSFKKTKLALFGENRFITSLRTIFSRPSAYASGTASKATDTTFNATSKKS